MASVILMRLGNYISALAIKILEYQGYFTAELWSGKDIALLCEQEGFPLPSNRQCQEIFARLQHNYDGDMGISWPVLRRAVHEYFTGQNKRSTCLVKRT